jgi:hypothetical protein
MFRRNRACVWRISPVPLPVMAQSAFDFLRRKEPEIRTGAATDTRDPPSIVVGKPRADLFFEGG